jgi:general secretion pathway protein A
MYIQFYSLKERPFSLVPDPKFLYQSESHKVALAYLAHAVSARKGFMVLTGEVGTGKTTLVHALLEKLDARTETAFIFNPMLGAKDFFKFICIQLGIQVKNHTRGDCLLEIYHFLAESHKNDGNVLLIIDEAHKLSPSLLEEIRLLSNFETTNERLLQIILIGQPELNFTLNLPKCRPLKQRISLWSYINPLNQKETVEYIRSRLRKAGLKTPCFTQEAIDEIFQYSKGIPRLINILGDNSLYVGYAMNEKEVNERVVREAIAEIKDYEARSLGSASSAYP